MPEFLAAAALLPQGWAADVRILADGTGRITAVEPGTRRAPAADRLRGAVLPGIPNLHGHAPRRALAGADPGARLPEALGPEALEAIAAMLQVELLEQGFTALCEVHDLHHQPDGRPYADPAEMALRHLAAARSTGIGLTLLPALRRHGGIFGKPARPEAMRGLNELDRFAAILARCREVAAGDPQAMIGAAPCDLGAVTPAMLQAVAAMDGPIHIHAARQQAEVAECLAAQHARPVEWLLDNAPVDQRWCVVHAIHIDPQEVEDLAASGAVAGLCPSSEAARGDGLFPLPAYRARGGRFGIGTDIHACLSPREELRQLETAQRLALRRADATGLGPHPARPLLEAVLAGGAQASGRPLGAIAPGMRCDLVELDPEHPALVGRAGDALLDAWVFGPAAGAVRTVVCGGRRVVEAGRHLARLDVAEAFGQAMRRLLA